MGGPALFGNSGDKTNINQTFNTTATDSYNSTFSRTDAFSNFGNTSLSIGPTPATGPAGLVANLGPYLAAGAFILGGLYLLNKR